MTKQLLWAR